MFFFFITRPDRGNRKQQQDGVLGADGMPKMVTERVPVVSAVCGRTVHVTSVSER